MLFKQQQLEPGIEQWTGSTLGKEYVKAVYCHPAYFNLHAEYIMWKAELDASQARIKVSVRNINNLRYVDDSTLMAEGEE